ncbi:MAG: hypothetical protein DMG13_07885, partial [Acidobacteria bacterium]
MPYRRRLPSVNEGTSRPFRYGQDTVHEAEIPASRLTDPRRAQLSEKYVEELEKLMGDDNPIIRSRALEHFRKTLGMEPNGAVRVNINNQQTAL